MQVWRIKCFRMCGVRLVHIEIEMGGEKTNKKAKEMAHHKIGGTLFAQKFNSLTRVCVCV